MIGQSSRSTWKKLHSVEFYQAPAQQQVGNGERSNVEVQKHTEDLSLQYKLLLKVQNVQQNNSYINHKSVHQKALKTD